MMFCAPFFQAEVCRILRANWQQFKFAVVYSASTDEPVLDSRKACWQSSTGSLERGYRGAESVTSQGKRRCRHAGGEV